jgi:hypothetical protein
LHWVIEMQTIDSLGSFKFKYVDISKTNTDIDSLFLKISVHAYNDR